jgi:hypothetical protein
VPTDLGAPGVYATEGAIDDGWAGALARRASWWHRPTVEQEAEDRGQFDGETCGKPLQRRCADGLLDDVVRALKRRPRAIAAPWSVIAPVVRRSRTSSARWRTAWRELAAAAVDPSRPRFRRLRADSLSAPVFVGMYRCRRLHEYHRSWYSFYT